jgi:hypothetical protein
MAPHFRKIRVLFSSPSDADVELRCANIAIRELNLMIELGHQVIPAVGELSIELLTGDRHAAPAIGRPQHVVNQAIDDYDIYIGVMWSRFGTPTGEGESGTAEEFERTIRRYEKTGQPQILFYFCEAPLNPGTLDLDQLKKVSTFKERVGPRVKYRTYTDRDHFDDVLRPDLMHAILWTIFEKGRREPAPDQIDAVVTGGTLEVRGLLGGPHFDLRGADFQLSNDGADHGNCGPATSCSPCRAGSKISLASTFAGDLGLGRGRGTIRGQVYEPLYYTGALNFSGSATTPAQAAEGSFTVDGEFSFLGSLRCYPNNPFVKIDPGSLIYDARLGGKGVATVTLSRSPGGLYFFKNVVYRFHDR